MATSVRALVVGSGTVSLSSGGGMAKLIFSLSQAFKPGAAILVINVDGAGANGRYTILAGADKIWRCAQQVNLAPSGKGFYTTDKSSSRGRGVGNTDITPGAVHYLYVSPINNSGVADWYTYADTVRPVRGLHPYTGDRFTGQSWVAKNDVPENAGVMVPDVGNRVAALDSLPPTLSA